MEEMIGRVSSPVIIKQLIESTQKHYEINISIIELYQSTVTKLILQSNVQKIEGIVQSLDKHEFDLAWNQDDSDGWEGEIQEERPFKDIEDLLMQIMRDLVYGENNVTPEMKIEMSRILKKVYNQ